ncbi:hypothetical protein [Desulfitobacterium metallireducens]|uniref:Tetratricopeptide repeat protein n=1 Tax=Desulfitobacterium metallireducens DSM 15288 TaxID=871968 RepID=W0EH27_9FIRM|nr:hypothetical protein [Desulfitobacterium metallireducens]AHF08519.1 hypothetical protein DESME_06450 [Desulfitobacterium metallireducens DSM 15288]
MSRRKRKRNSRVKGIFFLGIVALAILLAQPIFHLFQIRSAQDRFDMSKTASEIAWVKEKAPWLVKIPLVEDSALWLSLNQGEKVTDQQLLKHDDDKYRFWLLQLKLQQSQFTEANQILPTISSSTTQSLSQGLIDMAQGNYDVAYEQLNATSDLKLTKEEKVLKRLTLSRSLLGRGDQLEAKKEWEKAKSLAPEHPLVLEEEFDLALINADWKEAEHLSAEMEQWSKYDQNFDFQVKKALLYLALGETTQWENVLTTLNQTSKGKFYQMYLLGVQKYQEGEWKTAQTMLMESLNGELSTAIRNDANQALKQVSERLNADVALQKYQ